MGRIGTLLQMPMAALAFLTALISEAFADQISMDGLVGNWAIFDASGVQVGESNIELQSSGAMLHETRRVGDGEPQPLWFANLEHTGGWTQMFLSPAGIREFPSLSPHGEWPLVMGAEVTLRDGTTARFRLTVTPVSDNEHRRVLEISRDDGQSWGAVLDYTYRRAR